LANVDLPLPGNPLTNVNIFGIIILIYNFQQFHDGRM